MAPTYGLQFSDIYTRIKDYANINNVTTADTKAKRAANDALRLISTQRNWEQLKRSATLTPIAATQAYSLDSTFDHIISCWYVSNGVEVPIDVVDDLTWEKNVLNTTDSIPQICRITKISGTLNIQLSPRPSSSFVSQYSTISYDFIKKVSELSSDTDIPEIPDTASQMAIVYLAVSDLLGKQGDLNDMASWEAKATRVLNSEHKIDDKKQGRTPRYGTPLVPINNSKGARVKDY